MVSVGFVQAVRGKRAVGEVTARYNSVTNNRIEVASAIGAWSVASQAPASAPAPNVRQENKAKVKRRSLSAISPTIP